MRALRRRAAADRRQHQPVVGARRRRHARCAARRQRRAASTSAAASSTRPARSRSPPPPRAASSSPKRPRCPRRNARRRRSSAARLSGLGSLSYELAVTLNGQQYAAPSAWQGYHPPVVATISPTTGPLGGATVVTANGTSLAFGSDYRCAFGDAVVNATEVSGAVVNCTSPVGRSGPAPFRVSLNGQQYTEPVFWAFYGAPTLTPGTISPSSGPTDGNTSVVVSVAALGGGSDYRCAFGAVNAPGAVGIVHATALPRPRRCGAPRRPPPRASLAARSPSRSTASSTRHRRRRGSTTACRRRCCRCRAAGRTRAGRSSPSPARL